MNMTLFMRDFLVPKNRAGWNAVVLPRCIMNLTFPTFFIRKFL